MMRNLHGPNSTHNECSSDAPERHKQDEDVEGQLDLTTKYHRKGSTRDSRKSSLFLLDIYLFWLRKSKRQRLVLGMLMLMSVLILLYVMYLGGFDNRATVLDMMQCTHQVFVQHNITYFLDYGSLLGAIRHQGFIPWDDMDDIDVGVLAKDTENIYALGSLIKQRCGYHMIHRRDVEMLPNLSAFVIKRGAFRIFYNRITPIYIDIADYEIKTAAGEQAESQDEVYTDEHYPELSFHFPSKKLLPVVPCKFEDKTFLCPQDSAFILQEEFGKDWRMPKKGFKPGMVEGRGQTTALVVAAAAAATES